MKVIVLLAFLAVASAIGTETALVTMGTYASPLRCDAVHMNDQGVYTCSQLNAENQLMPITYFATSTPTFYCYDTWSCNYNGVCNRDHSACVCNSGYITSRNSFNNTQCDYGQKKQLVAWLLQFFVGVTGAAHFYAGNIGLGVAQIILCFGGIPLICVLPCLAVACDMTEDSVKGLTGCLYGLMGCAVGVWWLVDTILFGINYYNDGNNYPLQSW